MEVINDNVFNFNLLEGYSAETSGGIFCAVPPDALQDMQKELREVYGQDSWIVGDVTKGNRQVQWNKIEVINVEESFLSK